VHSFSGRFAIGHRGVSNLLASAIVHGAVCSISL
jgi:hypothetical protein